MSLTMQKQSARNLVLAPNTQTAYGGILAESHLTHRQRFDDSTVFEKDPSRANDKSMVGKGSEFATYDTITAWDTKGTLKADADTWLLGWALAMLFGTETVTGSATPYTHTYSIPLISATMPCTTIYVEETADQKYKLQDMAASSLSLTVPERGNIQLSLDMMGTGRWTPGAMMAALPALAVNNYLLGSDFVVTITPASGAATPFSGRQQGLTIKVDRGAAPFKASGDGLFAGSVASGDTKFSVDLTVAANQVDDVNGWFENHTLLSISIATNPANTYQLILTFPNAYVKANKLGNKDDKVMWGLSFDETTCLQSGNTPAISAVLINELATTYLTAA